MKRIIVIPLLIAFLIVHVGSLLGADGNTRTGTHQTTNTTWTPVASTCNTYVLIMNVSAIGTSWIITVKTKESTPRILWTGTAALGTVYILTSPTGIEMTSGIDVTFSGTAGVADFFLVYK